MGMLLDLDCFYAVQIVQCFCRAKLLVVFSVSCLMKLVGITGNQVIFELICVEEDDFSCNKPISLPADGRF